MSVFESLMAGHLAVIHREDMAMLMAWAALGRLPGSFKIDRLSLHWSILQFKKFLPSIHRMVLSVAASSP